MAQEKQSLVEQSLVELLKDPKARKLWETMIRGFLVKDRKLQKASETTQVKAFKNRLNDKGEVSGAFLCPEPEVFQALEIAQGLAKSCDYVLVKHENIAICPVSGVELVRVPGEYWTDEKMYVLPYSEVYTSVYGAERTEVSASADMSKDTSTSDTSTSKPNKNEGLEVRGDFSLSEAGRKFIYLVSSGGKKKVDSVQLQKNADLQRKAREAQKVSDGKRVLAGRNKAALVEPVKPEHKLFQAPIKSFAPPSPKKHMSAYERFLKAKGEGAKKQAIAEAMRGRIAKHEQEIDLLKKKLFLIERDINAIKRGNSGLVKGATSYSFREEVLPKLEEKAYQLRSDIAYEQRCIRDIKAGREL